MENSTINRLGDTLRNSLFQDNPDANVESSERVVSSGAGAFIAMRGIINLFSSPALALLELGVGGFLIYRGITGYCPLTAMLENEISSGQPEPETRKVTTSVTSAMGTDVSTGSTGNEGWTGMI